MSEYPVRAGRRRPRPSCRRCFKSRILEGATLKPDPQRRGGDCARREAARGSGLSPEPQIWMLRIERSPIRPEADFVVVRDSGKG